MPKRYTRYSLIKIQHDSTEKGVMVDDLKWNISIKQSSKLAVVLLPLASGIPFGQVNLDKFYIG